MVVAAVVVAAVVVLLVAGLLNSDSSAALWSEGSDPRRSNAATGVCWTGVETVAAWRMSGDEGRGACAACRPCGPCGGRRRICGWKEEGLGEGVRRGAWMGDVRDGLWVSWEAARGRERMEMGGRGFFSGCVEGEMPSCVCPFVSACFVCRRTVSKSGAFSGPETVAEVRLGLRGCWRSMMLR